MFTPKLILLFHLEIDVTLHLDTFPLHPQLVIEYCFCKLTPILLHTRGTAAYIRGDGDPLAILLNVVQ
jgi:hypothetical protein